MKLRAPATRFQSFSKEIIAETCTILVPRLNVFGATGEPGHAAEVGAPCDAALREDALRTAAAAARPGVAFVAFDLAMEKWRSG